MSGLWRASHSPAGAQSWPFAMTGPGEALPPTHVAGRCHCRQLHSPLEMAALNPVPKVLPTRPDKLVRNEAFGPGSRSSHMHDMTGTALTRGTQAGTAEAQPGQRVRQALGAEHFEREPEPVQHYQPPKTYSMGDLADGVGMSDPRVMRRWIKAGLMPEATIWTDGDTMPEGTGINGHVSTSRKRRWSERQFGGLVRLAIEERIAHRSVIGYPRVRSIKGTMFTQRAFKLFERIAADEADRHA
jgi:hypothetical protein